MGRPEKPQARSLSKLALVGCVVSLGGLSGCRAEPPPGAKAEPTAVHLEVSVQDNQGETQRLSAAEAAKPLPRQAKQPAAGGTKAKQAPPKSAAKVAERDPSPPEPANPEQAVAEKAPDAEADSRGNAKAHDVAKPTQGAVVPVGFSLGQDGDSAKSVVPPLLDDQGELLEQTKELPGTDSAFFKQIGPTLFKAIVDNNPELMLPYFMPVPVYEKLKDSKNPPRDWKYRLFAQLKRDIERYHRLLGNKRDRAHFVALDVVPEDALWMKPGREYNKLPYYRLFGSSLRYVDYRGRERRFEVSALFSWRGEWYVVHLNGLK